VLGYTHKSMRVFNHMPDPSVTRRARPRSPGKRAINPSLSSDVLDAAKDLQINSSQVCDHHLREVVKREHERRWREEHADFICAYNAIVEAEGLPLDEWRSF
jgi:antitoxin CcdA